MTKEFLIDRIKEWSYSTGECFVDRFMADNVIQNNWAFWLLGSKDPIKEVTAHTIINHMLKKKQNADQEDAYFVYPEYIGDKYIDENWDKNLEIWADFLLATPFYTELISMFLEGDQFPRNTMKKI